MKLAGTLIGHRWGRVALHMRCCLRNGKVASGRGNRLTVHHAVWVIAILVVLTCTVSTHAAYLASVGPAPLRFQEFADVKPKTVSSPLPQDLPETNFCIPEAVVVTNLAAPLVVTPAVTMIAQPEPVPACPSAVLSTNEVVVPPQITPQMVVEFFRSHAGSNGNRDAAIAVPYNFTPPMPSTKLSSSATYETP
jgi:hypothetical protein